MTSSELFLAFGLPTLWLVAGIAVYFITGYLDRTGQHHAAE